MYYAKYFLVVLLFFPRQSLGLPLPPKTVPSVEVLDFMKRYGYLDEGIENSEALYTEEAITVAIKAVQKFGGIPQTGVIDNATSTLMTSRRCGVPDVIRNRREKRYVLGSKGWRKRHITYYVSNWPSSLGEDTVADTVQSALDTWGGYAKLKFTRVYTSKADIVIFFTVGQHGDNFPFDGPGGILAHAFFPYEHHGVGGDAHFDADEDWTLHSEEYDEGTDFFTVAIHELGHSLGLSHSGVVESIMFPYYKGYTPDLTLNYDDILGMYELYIRGLPEQDPETVYEEEEVEVEVDIETTTHKNFDATITTTTTTNTNNNDTTIATEDDHEKPAPSIPDICEGNFDAVAVLREELFVFKNEYVWRLKERHQIEPDYPTKFGELFPFPETIKHVDAVYERPDGMIVFFTGKEFWVYDGQDFLSESPQPLTRYGFPEELNKVDAVQTWKKNGKTYLFYNERFWKYNEETKLMDDGYPKHIDRWRGVPSNLDAAMTWKDGCTYFFKDKYCWKFDNDWIMVTDSSPLPSPQTWLGCPENDFVRNYFAND